MASTTNAATWRTNEIAIGKLQKLFREKTLEELNAMFGQQMGREVTEDDRQTNLKAIRRPPQAD